MNIKQIQISVDDQTINPTLNCEFRIEYNSFIEIPISISGRLLNQNGKVLSLMSEYQINSDNFNELRQLTEIEKNKIITGRNKESQFIQLNAELSKLAIENIEEIRNKNPDKSIKFSLDIIVKTIEFNDNGNNQKFSVLIKKKNIFKSVIIEQSNWINSFSQKLGIGKYLLVELNIPEQQYSELWKNMFERLIINVNEMEKNIRIGDWYKTLFFARKFFDIIKFGDNKEAHKKFKDEFNSKMKFYQHSDEGINNLYDAIWKYFDFLSKFIHDIDKKGELYEVLPIPNKEDAYFAYSLSVNLLNLIGRKLE